VVLVLKTPLISLRNLRDFPMAEFADSPVVRVIFSVNNTAHVLSSEGFLSLRLIRFLVVVSVAPVLT